MLPSLLTLLLSAAHACGHADQYRLVPLGMQGDVLIALELDQLRRDAHSEADGLQYFWQVQPALVAIADHTTPLKVYPPVEAVDASYEGDLSGVLWQAQRDAAALNSFTPLAPTAHLDCAYVAHCTGAGDPTSGGTAWTDPSRYATHKGAPGGLRDVQGWHVGGVRSFGAVTVVTLGAGPHFDQHSTAPRPAEPQPPTVLSREGVPHHGISIDVIVR